MIRDYNEDFQYPLLQNVIWENLLTICTNSNLQHSAKNRIQMPTHYSPVLLIYSPSKHQKTFQVS